MGFKTLLLAHRSISFTGRNRQRKETERLPTKKKLRWKEVSAIQSNHKML